MSLVLDENLPPGQSTGKAPQVTALRRRPGAEVELLRKRLQLEERRRQEAELSLRDASSLSRQVKELVATGLEKDKKIVELHTRLNEAIVSWADAKLQLDDAQGQELAFVGNKGLSERLVAAESVALVLREERHSLKERLAAANEQILYLKENYRSRGTGMGELNAAIREAEAAKSNARVMEARLAIQTEISELQIKKLESAMVEKDRAADMLIACRIELGRKVTKLEKKLVAQWDLEDSLREELDKLGDVLAEKHDEELDAHVKLLNQIWSGSNRRSEESIFGFLGNQTEAFCREIVYGLVIDALDYAYREVARKRREAQMLFLPSRFRPPNH